VDATLTVVVGGDILDMALARAKPHARFVMCGAISQYNNSKPQGPKVSGNVLYGRRMLILVELPYDHRNADTHARLHCLRLREAVP
jgi:NADPH-dependent curcumin reductase CurA